MHFKEINMLQAFMELKIKLNLCCGLESALRNTYHHVGAMESAS
jgi:hypothetical protein